MTTFVIGEQLHITSLIYF